MPRLSKYGEEVIPNPLDNNSSISAYATPKRYDNPRDPATIEEMYKEYLRLAGEGGNPTPSRRNTIPGVKQPGKLISLPDGRLAWVIDGPGGLNKYSGGLIMGQGYPQAQQSNPLMQLLQTIALGLKGGKR